MSNPYFQFKEFTVYHDKCAMKVGTDGVLLGAWADVLHAKRILDIGTGSGLVALMLAQRNAEARIDALDIDCMAIEQARENVLASPFSGRINCQNISLQEFNEQNLCKYDRIVSNPPFFNHSLKSPNERRTLSRHTDELSVAELIRISANQLADNGVFSIVFPYQDKLQLIEQASHSKLYATKCTNVYPTLASRSAKRVLIEFSKEYSPLKENSLIIEISRHVYSENFIDLVKDFYLRM